MLFVDSGQIYPDEHFYPMQGYEDYYLLSTYGTVFSLKQRKIMKARVNKPSPYLYISIGNKQRNNKQNKAIHRLVAEHFVVNIDNKPIVDHIDDDPLNNHFTNLQYLTVQEHKEKSARSRKLRGTLRNPKWRGKID